MERKHRLRLSSDFALVRAQGQTWAHPLMILAGKKVANPGNISTRGIVLALEVEDYQITWEQTTVDAIYTSPMVTGDLLLVTPAQGDVLMQTFNAETGVPQWQFTPNSSEE